ncbi:hypothetical protein Tco_0629145 [Tanacetum coccineum]|uniref:Uncharacterized protein n=1 Tax=Tanacetum coccineum TaxID=301880 RepID=A0ABQ4WSB6_9ASTR
MPNVDILQGMDTGGSPRRPDTIGGAPAQIRSERVLEQPNEPPISEGHTSGSGEGSMEHQFELTANVPITPHDSPLPGGYTPGSDEGRLKLLELMTMCTKLSKQVLDLVKEKEEIPIVPTDQGIIGEDVELAVRLINASRGKSTPLRSGIIREALAELAVRS